MFNRVCAHRKRGVDAVVAMRMYGNFLAIKMRSVDQGLDLIIEYLTTQARPDTTVHAARRRDFDDVDTASDLFAHRLTAAFHTITQILLTNTAMKILRHRQGCVHMAASGGNRATGVNDAGARQFAGSDGIAQCQCRAATVAQIADGRKASHQCLLGIASGAIGCTGRTIGERFDQGRIAACITIKVHMAIDKARENKLVLKVDKRRACWAGLIARQDFDNLAIADDHGGWTVRCTAGLIEQPSCMNDRDLIKSLRRQRRTRKQKRADRNKNDFLHDLQTPLSARCRAPFAGGSCGGPAKHCATDIH